MKITIDIAFCVVQWRHKINVANLEQLGLVWYKDTNSKKKIRNISGSIKWLVTISKYVEMKKEFDHHE